MSLWNASRARPVPVDPGEGLAREGYRQHGGELYRFAVSRLGDEGLAQDAVQETVVRAWRAAGRFDPARGTLRTWLFAIMHNVVRDQATSRAKAPTPVVVPAEQPQGAVTDQMEGVVDSDLVVRALRTVSADQRDAIVQTFLRDRPYEEVARELGVSVSTLRSRVFYGLKQLKVAMAAMEVER